MISMLTIIFARLLILCCKFNHACLRIGISDMWLSGEVLVILDIIWISIVHLKYSGLGII